MSEAELSSAKRLLLERWRSGGVLPDDSRIKPGPAVGVFPLSRQQRSFWEFEETNPGTAVFTLSFVAWVRGPLDAGWFRSALVQLARRHGTMRSCVRMVDGEPMVDVAAEPAVRLDLRDLRGAPDAHQEALRIARAFIDEPFDLSRAPLGRSCLVAVEEEHHLYVTAVHHLVADGWSLGVGLRDLALLYAAGGADVLDPLPVQYTDYTAWQRRWFDSGAWRHHVAWWRERLAGAAGIRWRTASGDPAAGPYECHSRAFTLTAGESLALRELGRAEGITLYMTLFAVLAALLHRLSGATDLVVGSPTANRQLAQTEPLIGVFINTIFLRASLGGDPSFRRLLLHARDVCTEAVGHQDFPLDELLGELARDGRGRPDRVLFVLQNFPMPEGRLGEATMEPVEFETPGSSRDLGLYVWDRRPELTGRLNASRRVFSPAEADAMLRELRSVVARVVADPDRRLSEL